MIKSWTDEQAEAIAAASQSGGILVSAAAGSGKTAVLVERVADKILNGGMSIDRVLIVTFTDAAASEMRDKIIKRLYAELNRAARNGEDTEFIKRQTELSADADILTIDSFCVRVLRNNFYIMGADPDFRIADSAEAELMADDAADALFGRLYGAAEDSEDGRRFNHLLNIYATNRSDDGLRALVLRIHGFIQSFARPLEWLDEKAGMYAEDMRESEWVKSIVPEMYIRARGRKYYGAFSELVRDMCDECGAAYDGGAVSDGTLAAMKESFGEIAYGLYALQKGAKELSEAQSWADAHAVYEKYVRDGGTDRLDLRNRPKDISVPIEDWKRMCGARNDIKRAFFEDCAAFKTEDIGGILHGSGLKELVDEIVWLVKEFDAEFARRKEARSVKEFSDIEHMVYNLFSENEEARLAYRDRYDEILIDEYQDTNGLQDSIFRLISRDGNNLFMVGDLKQSIYRFRGGDPTIFMDRSKSCDRDDTGDIRINLSQNFRSRQEILRSVNDVFETVMTESVGDVNYEGKERIVRLSDDGARDDRYKSEAHFVVFNGGDDETDIADAEAEFIAERISGLLNGGFTIDDGGNERPLKTGDICILSRSVKSGTGAILTDALARRGINARVEIEDYFEKREIKLMKSLISVIDNNLQDIPLTAVMRSPIGGFSDNDLARIRIYSPGESLFRAVKNYRSDETGMTGAEIALKIKCRRLVRSLEKWRGYVKRKSVANLIWSIYEETGLYDFMGAFEGGEEAQANLRLLYERAKNYEQSGFKGLFNFIRYMEKLENRRGDLSSAGLAGDGRGAVRIMTIHKSKGLEFPVVLLAGMGKNINIRGGGANVALHKDLGFGVRYADADAGYFEDTLFSQLVCEQNRREDISEAMRLLYVGMTRPKSKLIIVAAKKYSDSAKQSYLEKAYDRIEKWRAGIPAENASSYADWIYPAALRNPGDWDFEFHDRVCAEEETEDEETESPTEVSDELREVIKRSFEFEYEYPKSGYIPSKTSVTALKQRGADTAANPENADRKDEYDPVYMEDKPAFMRDGKSGAEIGTAHHQVMAFIDLDTLRSLGGEEYEAFAESEIKRIAGDGQIDMFYFDDEKMRRAIAGHIAEFFKSGIGARMLAAERVYREKPFQIEIGADIYDGTLDKKYSDEKVILQGVIDCFFENPDGSVTLVDYKTDRCSGEEQIRETADKYALQLKLYADAIERITKKRVAKRYLYLFAPARAVEV